MENYKRLGKCEMTRVRKVTLDIKCTRNLHDERSGPTLSSQQNKQHKTKKIRGQKQTDSS